MKRARVDLLHPDQELSAQRLLCAVPYWSRDVLVDDMQLIVCPGCPPDASRWSGKREAIAAHFLGAGGCPGGWQLCNACKCIRPGGLCKCALVRCPMCEDEMAVSTYATHLSNCPGRPVTCADGVCDAQIAYRDVEMHRESCEKFRTETLRRNTKHCVRWLANGGVQQQLNTPSREWMLTTSPCPTQFPPGDAVVKTNQTLVLCRIVFDTMNCAMKSATVTFERVQNTVFLTTTGAVSPNELRIVIADIRTCTMHFANGSFEIKNRHKCGIQFAIRSHDEFVVIPLMNVRSIKLELSAEAPLSKQKTRLSYFNDMFWGAAITTS